MREIEFRGQQIVDKHWVYGYLYREKGLYLICKNIRYDEAEPIFLDTIGQYTGLKDRNQTKIYEGDILKTKYNGKEYIVWIEYNEEYAEFDTRCNDVIFDNEPLGDLSTRNREIIGNIHDNPELIEKCFSGLKWKKSKIK